MASQRTIETMVGLFLLSAIAALLVLAIKVSGLTDFFRQKGYTISAEFTDIGQLKPRSPVKMAGVLIGEVEDITLDPTTYKATVRLNINSTFNKIPDDSSASILTAGLLGDNYIAVEPMDSETFFKEGGKITDTHSAMILEKLIGQLAFKLTGKSTDSASSSDPVNSQSKEVVTHE